MKTLLTYIKEAEAAKKAIGHFNISNIEGLWGVFRAAQSLKVPIIIGVSEGERKFIGLRQVKVLVDSLRAEFDYPIFLNADHTYDLEGIKAAVTAGFDAVIADGASLPLADNINLVKQAVAYTKEANPEILVEGEIGYIGTSSQVMDEIPAEVTSASASLTTPDQAWEFIEQTAVDLLSPAVDNMHGMLKNIANPKLDIDRIKAIKEAVGEVPLVLHGGSGTTDQEFTAAIEAGMSVIHINTEIRVAYRDALKFSLQANPDEVAPYRIMAPVVKAIEEKVRSRLKLFSHQ